MALLVEWLRPFLSRHTATPKGSIVVAAQVGHAHPTLFHTAPKREAPAREMQLHHLPNQLPYLVCPRNTRQGWSMPCPIESLRCVEDTPVPVPLHATTQHSHSEAAVGYDPELISSGLNDAPPNWAFIIQVQPVCMLRLGGFEKCTDLKEVHRALAAMVLRIPTYPSRPSMGRSMQLGHVWLIRRDAELPRRPRRSSFRGPFR